MKLILQNSTIEFRQRGNVTLEGTTISDYNFNNVGLFTAGAGYYYQQFDLSQVQGGFIKVTTTLNNQYVGLVGLYAANKVPPTGPTQVTDVLNNGNVGNTRDNKTMIIDMSQYPTAKYLCMGLGTSSTVVCTVEWHPTNDF